MRLLYEGKPLAGALILALQKGRPEAKVSARSDARGRAGAEARPPGLLAGQGRAHDPRSERDGRRLGELLGLLDV